MSLRREPSSLYTFLAKARLRSALPRNIPRGFTEFDSYHLPHFHDSARLNKTGAFNRSANLPYGVSYHSI